MKTANLVILMSCLWLGSCTAPKNMFCRCSDLVLESECGIHPACAWTADICNERPCAERTQEGCNENNISSGFGCAYLNEACQSLAAKCSDYVSTTSLSQCPESLEQYCSVDPDNDKSCVINESFAVLKYKSCGELTIFGADICRIYTIDERYSCYYDGQHCVDARLTCDTTVKALCDRWEYYCNWVNNACEPEACTGKPEAECTTRVQVDQSYLFCKFDDA